MIEIQDGMNLITQVEMGIEMKDKGGDNGENVKWTLDDNGMLWG